MRSPRSASWAAGRDAWSALARAVLERRVVLNFAANVEEQIEALMRLPGIGPWTAHYIAMRALHWPDAFPSGDLMLMRAAQCHAKGNSGSAPRPGGRGARTPLIIYGSHWESYAMNIFCHVDSPIGRLLLTSDGTALTGLYMEPSRKAASHRRLARGWRARARCRRRCGRLKEYFAGARREFDLPLRLQGTDFQKRVWRELDARFPMARPGATDELAKRIGNPNASRAVGLANGRNPICHPRALPSGDRRRRISDRIRRRPRAQALAACARGAAGSSRAGRHESNRLPRSAAG